MVPCPEIMTTVAGGSRSRSRLRVSSPSSPAIFTSSSTTCGRNSEYRLIPSPPEAAVRTSHASYLRTWRSASRMPPSSSMTNTRLPMALPFRSPPRRVRTVEHKPGTSDPEAAYRWRQGNLGCPLSRRPGELAKQALHQARRDRKTPHPSPSDLPFRDSRPAKGEPPSGLNSLPVPEHRRGRTKRGPHFASIDQRPDLHHIGIEPNLHRVERPRKPSPDILGDQAGQLGCGQQDGVPPTAAELAKTLTHPR